MPTDHTDPAKHEGSTVPTARAKHEGSTVTTDPAKHGGSTVTTPAKHGKSAVPAGTSTTIDGRFLFRSALTEPGVGIFTGGPYYIGIFNDTPGWEIIIVDGANDNGVNWIVTVTNVTDTCAVQNEFNGFCLDCPDSTGPGVGVIQTGFFLDNSSPTQQWNFELVKSIDDGDGFIANGYFIRNRFNNLVITVPGVDQPGFLLGTGIPVTLDLAFPVFVEDLVRNIAV